MRTLRALYLLVALMFVTGLVALPYMPNPAPMHWNIAGEVDGYGHPLMAVMIAPLIALAMVVLMPLLPKFDPRRENYPSFAGSYEMIMSALVLFFALVHGLVIAAALGWPVSVPRIMMVGMGLLFGVIGNVLGRVQPNYFVGIRTPWTLADPEIWRRSHRVGGRMFVAAGALTLLLGLFAPVVVGFSLGLTAILVAAFGSMAYSYWIARQQATRL